MPNTRVPAAAPGLPASRRGFLRGLVTLPLIGGGVSLIGAPIAVAEPCTLSLMKRYVAWLAQEHGQAHDALVQMLPPGERFYFPELSRIAAPIEPIAGAVLAHWPDDPLARAHVSSAPPSTRAALVLSTVGCDWRSTPEGA